MRSSGLVSEGAGADPRLVDALLAVSVAVLVAVAIAADLDSTGRATPGAYLFAIGFGAVLLARRRAPRLVLAVTVLGVFAYYTFEFAAMGIALPAVAALYSAAEAGRARFALAAGATLVAVAALAQIIAGMPTDYLLSYEMLTNAALIVTAIALGSSVRNRRHAREHQERLREAATAELALAAERQVQEERMRIARDLHDAVGHSMSVIAVHTHVAAEAVGHDDAALREAISRIEDATSTTLRELRTTVKVLRSPSTAVERGAVGLAGLDRLTDSAGQVGLSVELDVQVPQDGLDGAIDAAVYRIVQESLTNVLRHADAHRATVTVRVQDGHLHLTITDDGHGTQGRGTDPPGAGLAGMKERAALLGGVLTTQDDPHGFVVRAELPMRLR